MTKVTLSARQEQVLQFLLIGYRQTEIARELGISAKSVHTHIRFAADKFDVIDLAHGGHQQLLVKAREHFEFVRGQPATPSAGTSPAPLETPVSTAGEA